VKIPKKSLNTIEIGGNIDKIKRKTIDEAENVRDSLKNENKSKKNMALLVNVPIQRNFENEKRNLH